MLNFLVVALLATACGRAAAEWTQFDELGQLLGIEEAQAALEPSWATVTYGDERGRSLLQYSPSTAPKIRVTYTSFMGVLTTESSASTCSQLSADFITGMKTAYASLFGLQPQDVVLTCYNVDGSSQLLRRRLSEVFPQGVLGIRFTVVVEVQADQAQALLETVQAAVNGGTITALTTYYCGCPTLVLPLQYLDGAPASCIVDPPNLSTSCPPDQWQGGGNVNVILPNITIPFQVDSFVDNNLPCGVFWQQSMPRGSKPPNAALRLGLRTVSDAIAGEQGWAKADSGGVYKVMRMSNLCTNPPKSVTGKAKTRKRMRTSITPRVPTGQNGLYLSELKKKVDAGDFRDAAAAWGAGVWTPLPFQYNNPLQQAVCAPTVPASHCAGGWKPRKITPL